MVDLNNWRLAYSDTVLNFGTMSTTYPFSTQVDIGDPDLIDQDSNHPTSDGRLMGRDALGGFDITFKLTTVPEFPPPDKPWLNALDLFSSFRAAWRADDVRRTPGAYATLRNLERQRMVYGRPRKCTPTHDRLRKGVIGYIATFDTNGPDFYDTTEKVALLTAAAPTGSGFTTPIRPPFAWAVAGDTLATTDNNGDLDTWPIITFHGPGSSFSLECYDGSRSVWKISIDDGMWSSEAITIDTRPWSRGATMDDGRPANGRLRGAAIEQCMIPVGNFNLRLRVKDRTGQAFATVKWRDAFASL